MEKPFSSQENPRSSHVSPKKWAYAEALAKALALSTLLFFSRPDLKAQEKEKGDSLKENYHELVVRAHALSDSLYRQCLDARGGLGGVDPFARPGFLTEDERDRVSFGVGDPQHPLSVYFETKDASNRRYRYIDDNADGSVDRVLVDSEPGLDDLHKNMLDAKVWNLSIANIAKGEGFAPAAAGKDIDMYELDATENRNEVKLFSFKDNKQGEISGVDAKKWIGTIQQAYAENLKYMADYFSKRPPVKK